MFQIKSFRGPPENASRTPVENHCDIRPKSITHPCYHIETDIKCILDRGWADYVPQVSIELRGQSILICCTYTIFRFAKMKRNATTTIFSDFTMPTLREEAYKWK